MKDTARCHSTPCALCFTSSLEGVELNEMSQVGDLSDRYFVSNLVSSAGSPKERIWLADTFSSSGKVGGATDLEQRLWR